MELDCWILYHYYAFQVYHILLHRVVSLELYDLGLGVLNYTLDI